jgi:hypothetical protein
MSKREKQNTGPIACEWDAYSWRRKTKKADRIIWSQTWAGGQKSGVSRKGALFVVFEKGPSVEVAAWRIVWPPRLRPPHGVRRGGRSVGRWDTALGGAHGARGRRCSVGGPILRAASPTATPPLPERKDSAAAPPLCMYICVMRLFARQAPAAQNHWRLASLSLTCVSLTHSPIDGWRSGDLKNSNPSCCREK